MRERTRLEAAIAWIGWHLGELAAVAISIAAAARVSWWFLISTAVIAAVWAVQEWRHYRLRARARAQRQLPTPTPADADSRAVVHVLPREGA